ncbi:GNAT family N-acetyltransferase [Lactonifactor sp. BIOML-A7]|uniref:GNAT family N-acetyltransferase n=3 Tax=Clostridiaceae TaxID=31979 RepID=UPI001FA9F32B|nr:GNAT family N-acetyltransferase [Lactonifactor sp. BIOML-A7]
MKTKRENRCMTMNLHFVPVNPAIRRDVESLRTLPEQTGFIESVSDCMKEADESPKWRPVGIYDGNMLVGFAMYGCFQISKREGEVWLDRILIDGKHQGRGYGREAVSALLKRLHQEYGKKQVYLSVYESNTAAIHLYKQLGFQFNGKCDTKGEKIMVYTGFCR